MVYAADRCGKRGDHPHAGEYLVPGVFTAKQHLLRTPDVDVQYRTGQSARHVRRRRPLRSLANATEHLRHGDYRVRSAITNGEVGQLARNVNALAETLEQEELRRARFMADLGHELRTPIMSLRGYTEGLEDGVFVADDGYFKLISAELSHLAELTRTIETMRLDSEIQANSNEDTPYTVDALLTDAKCRWDPRLNQRGLQLCIYIPVELKDRLLAVNSRSLKQIADNLLSNMFRYAAPGQSCRIDVSGDESPACVCVAFSNLAPDVSDASLPFLFDRFYRVSQSRTRVRHEHSCGLGLSVVKQLCVANHGKVSASLNGARLAIRVTLPVSSHEQRSRQPTLRQSPPRNRSALPVE